MKRKICVVVTARASYSRIKTALTVIHQHPHLTLQLVLSGSATMDKYGSIIEQVASDGFNMMATFSNVHESDPVATISQSMIDVTGFFKHHTPDLVVTIADRFETIATALAASLLNIPLVHIQGGEVSGNIDNRIRNAVTQLADYHFVATESAHNRVIELGAKSNQVFNTGCPSIDIALNILSTSDQYNTPFITPEGGLKKIDLNAGFVVVMQHPVTTEYPDAQKQVQETLSALEALQLPTLWFWPNADIGTQELSSTLWSYQEQNPDSCIQFVKNLDADQFLILLKKSLCLIGNSSVGIRECSCMGIPVVNIGTRQNGRERANNVLDVPYHAHSILEAIKFQIGHGHYPPASIYGNGNAGTYIADILSHLPISPLHYGY